MKFYTNSHKYACGIDLHTKMMYVCILDKDANILIHQNISTDPTAFLSLIKPYQDDIVVGVECIFSWYWIADLCTKMNLDFILGHALYMKCIHGGKKKTDKIDSEKIARLIIGNTFPMAYTYPPEMRAIRDLLRRRSYFVRFKSDVQGHISITNYQCNNPPFEKHIGKKGNRKDIAKYFPDADIRKNVDADIFVMDAIQEQVTALENYIVKHAKKFDPRTFYRLQSIPGVGNILALTIMYEVEDIHRFPTVQNFASYCRLVKGKQESAGKTYGTMGRKIGNKHLKWAFGEAACLMLRDSEGAKNFIEQRTKKFGKAKALSQLAHKIGRAVYYMLKRNDAFDERYFFSQ